MGCSKSSVDSEPQYPMKTTRKMSRRRVPIWSSKRLFDWLRDFGRFYGCLAGLCCCSLRTQSIILPLFPPLCFFSWARPEKLPNTYFLDTRDLQSPRALAMTNDNYRYRDRSSSRSARDDTPMDDHSSEEDVIVDEDDSVHLEHRDSVSPMRAYLIRALALLCACSLSIGSH